MNEIEVGSLICMKQPILSFIFCQFELMLSN